MLEYECPYWGIGVYNHHEAERHPRRLPYSLRYLRVRAYHSATTVASVPELLLLGLAQPGFSKLL